MRCGATGMLDRALISSQYRSSLELIRAAEPRVRLGWSVPKVTRIRSARAAHAAAGARRDAGASRDPADQAARAIRARACDAVMVHWRLVTPRLVRAVARRRRRALRVDGRRARAAARLRGARRHRPDHERPAAVRGARRPSAAASVGLMQLAVPRAEVRRIAAVGVRMALRGRASRVRDGLVPQRPVEADDRWRAGRRAAGTGT